MNSLPIQEESLIEQRLATLEQQVADILSMATPRKDWKSTVGMWKDDEFSREVDRLGQEWRKSVTD